MWPSCHTESERTMDPTAALAQGEQLLEQRYRDPQALTGNGQQRSWLRTPVKSGRAEADRPRQYHPQRLNSSGTRPLRALIDIEAPPVT